MNNINRPLVKLQAKQLIKEKVFLLFLISAIALALTTGITTIFQIETNLDSIDDYGYFDRFDDDDYDDYDDDDYDDFDDYFERNFNNGSIDGNKNSSDNPIESFGKAENQSFTPTTNNANIPSRLNLGISSSALSILGTILSPLLITLLGFYVMFVRRNPEDELNLGQEIGNLFKHSFNGSYIKKLVVYILRNIFTALWSMLFIVPGVVYHYSSYFAFQLMYEHPNLKPTEALKLSKKIVKGNRTELFLLDLSFIPWYLLCGVTVGIASIYVIPYVMTTQALYYENFRIRALSEGRITEDDFLSIDELTHKYASNADNQAQQFGGQQYYNPYEATQNTAQNQNYYTPNSHGSNTQQNYYYQPEPQQAPQNEPQTEDYYTPPQSEPQPQPEEYYTPPQETTAPIEDNNDTNTQI